MQGRPKEFERDEALAAATEVFWKQGFEGASMAQLLEQMGINRQSAYDTFGDKRALFMEALRKYVERMGTAIGEVLQGQGGGDKGGGVASPVERVRLLLQRLSHRACATDGRGCLLTNAIVELAPHDPQIRGFVSETLNRVELMLAETLRAAVAAGELRQETDPVRLARLLLTVMQGALVLSKTNLGGHAQDAVDLLESMMLRR
jgi:TetR/AcrR family transcriptional repressor of nem operon